MEELRRPVHIRWADLDANFHLRHSCYYDMAAQLRLEVLGEHGITLRTMQEQGFGPILFREECVFKREIRYADKITLDLKLRRLRKDHARWSFHHEFVRDDGTLCAVLMVDGAWMDTRLRKLAAPPVIAEEAMAILPRTDDFELVERPA